MMSVTANELIEIPVSPGELIDKITILELKLARIADPKKCASVSVELDLLTSRAAGHIPEAEAIAELRARLASVNARLWDVEEALRAAERQGLFDAAFVSLARSVYRLNDERAVCKAEINALLGSAIREVKSY